MRDLRTPQQQMPSVPRLGAAKLSTLPVQPAVHVKGNCACQLDTALHSTVPANP
jgi:hypothetical protein